ncbi:regulatory protein, luxR family [Actinacidiphila alni]|uniref:Regulatory protein, luxR family n=1 Tax=Actinacidiphila alni TaxID=380248 RepID=A0A1I2FCS5_9ACTN|nr:regulatory protein, luxR family [Actinacidiphila alni]
MSEGARALSAQFPAPLEGHPPPQRCGYTAAPEEFDRAAVARALSAPEEPAVTPGTGTLSGRERGVVTLVARGLNNAEIATALDLSPLTVKTHISRIMRKLGARDRAQLVITGYESGLVTFGTAGPPDADSRW